jgi:hypothetical protein
MEEHAHAPGGPLKITFGSKSAERDAAKLGPLPHATLTLYNEHVKANQTYSGVPLIDLLAQLGVSQKPHGKDFVLYLVAEGSDGYQVVFPSEKSPRTCMTGPSWLPTPWTANPSPPTGRSNWL